MASLWDQTTVLSTSRGKTFFFAWRFTLNGNILFLLTTAYQNPFVFSVSVFCSQICTLKLNLRQKIGLNSAISIVVIVFFLIFVLEIIFYFFFAEFILLMFHKQYCETFRKKLNKRNIENLPPPVTYSTDFCIICIQFYSQRKRKPTKPNKHKSNKRTKRTRISSLFPKRGNRNAKRTEKHKNKITQGKTYNKSPRRINYKATKSKINTGNFKKPLNRIKKFVGNYDKCFCIKS